MLNGKYTSIYPIIEEVYQDSGFQKIDWSDVATWIPRCIGKIGYPGAYIDKITNNRDGLGFLKVENYRTLIPEDLITVVGMRRVKLRDDTPTSGDPINGVGNSNCDCQACQAGNPEDCALVLITCRSENVNSQIYTTQSATTTDNPIIQWWAMQENLDTFYQDELNDILNPEVNTYRLNNGLIQTNFKEGWIELTYKAMPVDEHGFPLIPEDDKYMEAIKWYIMERVAFKRWMSDRISESKYREIERQSLWYVAAAGTKGKMVNIDKMEAIKNMLQRTIPKTNEHYTGFKTSNIQEQRYNRTRR